MKYKKLTWKNILSYGNKLTSLNLDSNNTVGITGINGHGKSTLLDIFHFVLTGKPYRKVNKSQLVNTTNKKNCLVILEIEHKNKKIVIERGIKPDIFKINVDGIELDQDSKSLDQQKWMSQFLNINPKTLRNTHFISSTNYSPFLQMTALEKRTFIEDILNIEIFSNIQRNLKAKHSIITESIRDCQTKINQYESNLQIIKEMLSKQDEDSSDKIKNIEVEIATIKVEIRDLETEENGLNVQIQELTDIVQDLSLERNDLSTKRNNQQNKYDEHIEKLREIKLTGCNHLLLNTDELDGKKGTLSFYTDNNICPTCTQLIDPTFKENIVSGLNDRISELNTKNDEYQSKLAKLEVKKKKLDGVFDKIAKVSDKITKMGNDISNKQSEQHVLQEKKSGNTRMVNSKLNTITNRENDIKELKKPKKGVEDNSEKINGQLEEQNRLLNRYNDTSDAYDLAFKLLSDKGIKQYIIKNYIPLLNRYVNQFLEIFQAHYRIQFDENMKETIAVKGYEKLSYNSLSAGERARVDLSLLFAFLNVSKSREYVTSNILILDEVADANLDSDGLEGLIEILEKLKQMGYTTFTISHRKELSGRFDESYVALKKKFSQLIQL